MTLISAWNQADWSERQKFLMVLARKDPDLLRRTLKRIEREMSAQSAESRANSPS